MKKQILLILSLIVILFSSCSKSKTERKLNNSTVKKNEVVESNSFQSSSVEKSDSYQPTSVEKPILKKEIASNIESTTKKEDNSEIEALKQKHAFFLENSPFKKTLKLSKKERKALGIPPNKYFESEWELTMNPATGKPDSENLYDVRKKLLDDRALLLATGRTPGDASDNSWVERGPTNVGGRTRAVMFDPNDLTKETVFAGGVSGGLWKNTNISNASSTWSRVNIPDNLAVTCITYDPINTNVFYLGTGESYVGGDAVGDGVWKSIDGGTSWTKVFGGISGATTFQSASNITINSPSTVIGNYSCLPNTPSNFGVNITSPITADIVLVNDGTPAFFEGCNALTNNLTGKIALVRRGNCTFIQKVLNAQAAGAIGVIIMNNVAGSPILMGGTDTTITIPTVMISKEHGDLIEAALTTGTLNGTLNPSTPGGFTGNLVPGKQHINDLKIRNNGGVTEIYAAVGDTSYWITNNPTTYLGGPDFGLYKSVNGGNTWAEVSLPLTSSGNKHCPMDIEIGSDNKIWISTTRSTVFNDGGGMIFTSTDGSAFIQKYEVVGGRRTQIAVSKSVADKIYLLSDLGGGSIAMKSTTNGFNTVTDMTLPVDADSSIPATDFCRQQAFYDLMLEVDPTNDQTLYAGGIDLFKSTNAGTAWTQLSHWYGGFGFPDVHSDQHGMAFANGAPNKVVFGNDGGVFFSNTSGTNAVSRNLGYNVTQFYSVAVAPTSTVSGLTGDYFVAGAQDNGSQYFANAAAGASASNEVQGGDGAICLFDQGVDKYMITNYVYNNSINYRTTAGTTRVINSETTENGAFIAPMALDSNKDVLYSDYTSSTPTYQIRRYTNLKSGTVGKTILTNALLTSSPTALTVSKYTSASTTLLVGCKNGKVLKVTTANTTPIWTDISNSAFVGSVSDIEFGSSNTEILVTFHNYNVVNIWYSPDGGQSWENKEGDLPDLPVKCILQNPLNVNEVIIGTELGVWFTNNFNDVNPNWHHSYNGMSNVKVTDLDLRNDNAVFASTYGRGVFSGMFTSATLSTKDIVKGNKNVTVYPNPSEGVLNINIADYNGKISIKLLDINGRVVIEKNNEDFNLEKTLNLNQFSSGMYILKINGDNLNYTDKIMLKGNK